jgi:hypothetical protein
MFAANSIWHHTFPADAPIDPKSPEYVANLVAQVAAHGATFEYRDWSITRWTAGAGTATQKVWLDAADNSQPKLVEAISAVPIPAEMRPPGPFPGDNPVCISDPTNDRYWEFHGMRLVPFEPARSSSEVAGCSTLAEPGWHCDGAAAVASVSTSPGYFVDNAWPGVTGKHWGVSGSGLFLWHAPITVAEAQRGYIPHPIRFECVDRQKTTFRWPAQKTDGKSTDPTAPMEGMLFRLPASWMPKHSDPFIRAVEAAIRDRGLLLTDGASNVSIKCASEATVGGSQSYTTDAWKGSLDQFGKGGAIFSKFPNELGPDLPWSSLEVVDVSYRPGSIAPGMLGRG